MRSVYDCQRIRTTDSRHRTGYRARVADYRIIYTFDLDRNKLHLLAIGHRREIYRNI